MVAVVGISARAAGLQLEINVRTAQYYVKKYKDDNEKRTLLPRITANISFANNRKLYENHTDFLYEIFDKKADLTLWEARDMLLNAFPEVYNITLSALHKHLVTKASVTLKKLDKITAAKDSEITVSIRHDRIFEWKKTTQTCGGRIIVSFFFYEEGFNMHLRRNFGR